MTTRKKYSAQERRTWLAHAQGAWQAYDRKRRRDASIALGANPNELVVSAWYEDSDTPPIRTFRVAIDDLEQFGPSHIIKVITEQLPLRTPHLRGGAR